VRPCDGATTVAAVLGISGGDPSFRDDDGSADTMVSAALAAFAAGQQSETAALTALAGSRLLVPVVAVLAEQLGQEGEQETEHDTERRSQPGAPVTGASGAALHGEKASEMAMPTLIGMDGRRAVPAFTSMDSMRRWQPDARPVPVRALHVWQAAVADSCAVVVDVGGPVPLAVEGYRLAALARGEEPPAPWADPDVREVAADVLAGELDIAAFELHPGAGDSDLAIALTLAPAGLGRDATELATQIASAVMARLGGRLRRGVAIWLGRPGGSS
jgi:hypothetical protein